jgi:hypothetical protein
LQDKDQEVKALQSELQRRESIADHLEAQREKSMQLINEKEGMKDLLMQSEHRRE